MRGHPLPLGLAGSRQRQARCGVWGGGEERDGSDHTALTWCQVLSCLRGHPTPLLSPAGSGCDPPGGLRKEALRGCHLPKAPHPGPGPAGLPTWRAWGPRSAHSPACSPAHGGGKGPHVSSDIQEALELSVAEIPHPPGPGWPTRAPFWRFSPEHVSDPRAPGLVPVSPWAAPPTRTARAWSVPPGF